MINAMDASVCQLPDISQSFLHRSDVLRKFQLNFTFLNRSNAQLQKQENTTVDIFKPTTVKER
jgi:hypothetical protein